MTSNVGADILSHAPEGSLTTETREQVYQNLRSHFAPEFMNRIDDIVLFNRLTTHDITKIVDLQIQELTAQLRDKDMTLNVSDQATSFLSTHGYDATYGARPLQRLVQKQIKNQVGGLVYKALNSFNFLLFSWLVS
jgi:ATP-dependent Clp protease ATP-binding subunit ClpB